MKPTETHERFIKLSASYEDEQATLNSRITELESIMAQDKEDSRNIDSFLKIVKKYTDIKELSAEIYQGIYKKVLCLPGRKSVRTENAAHTHCTELHRGNRYTTDKIKRHSRKYDSNYADYFRDKKSLRRTPFQSGFYFNHK